MMMPRSPLLLTLAWRNLWRHSKRTLVILFAIILGVWFMIISAAMTVGIIEQQLQDTIMKLTGHIQIHHPQYIDDPAIEYSMSPPNEPLLKVLNQPEIKHWSARVRLPAVIMSERESRGITLLGIDPIRENGLSFIANAVVSGRYLDSTTDTGIIIGRRLAEQLDTQVGKRIVIMTQDKNNEVADRGFRIVGLFEAEMQATETAFVFTGLTTVQKLTGMENQLSEISLMTDSREKLEPLVNQLKLAAPELETKSWQSLEPLLVASMALYEKFIYIWYLIIFIAMAFGLINTLLMAVFERTRELGLFQALGMQPRLIIAQVVIESSILLAMGIAIGNIAGVFTAEVIFATGIDLSEFSQGMEQFSMATTMHFIVRLKDLLTINLLVFILGVVASLYPAVKAARFVPVEAITRT